MLGPLQKQFVEALRSGKYEQGKSALCVKDKYCCLGVACEIAGIKHKQKDDDGIVCYEETSYILPLSVKTKMCFRDTVGYGLDGLCLMEMNDHEDKSFADIADAIEANPSNFFTGPA